MTLSNASIVRLTRSAPLQAAYQSIQRDKILELAIAIQQIPAPTFDEHARAAYVQTVFEQIGLQQVEMDDLYNVYGWLPGQAENSPVLLVSAHTDTVFPRETNLEIRKSGGQVFGPGLGDNSLGVAALIALAELFLQYDIPHEAAICFVANTREEGLGDLGGIKAAVQKLQDRTKAAVIIEGMALGRIYHSGIAVRRLKLTVKTPGGHSWLHFGQPSAIHVLMQFGAAVSQIHTPEEPRTTYNIGIIEGGSSINTIAAEASCLIDLRSSEMGALADLEAQVRAIGDALATEDIHLTFEQVGDRPAGSIPADHPLVRLAKHAHEAINMHVELDGGSTDANVPLALGIPAVCVGVSYGGNAHRLDEYIEVEPIVEGMWQLLLLTAAASNGVAAW